MLEQMASSANSVLANAVDMCDKPDSQIPSIPANPIIAGRYSPIPNMAIVQSLSVNKFCSSNGPKWILIEPTSTLLRIVSLVVGQGQITPAERNSLLLLPHLLIMSVGGDL